jgi:hypothetical protein
MLTPKKSVNRLRFSTLAGAEDVRLAGSNKFVGRFQANLKDFYALRKGRLIEEFLNWPSDPSAILHFTRKYGPLRAKPVEGKEFKFSWFEWTLDQRRLRSMWERRRVFQPQEWEQSNGSLLLQKDGLTYRAENLYAYLCMDLVTCEPKRLRKCKRPDCTNPYFIAGHLKQRFCSDICAEWGQREWKKQWWKEHGEEWRNNRAKQMKLKRR